MEKRIEKNFSTPVERTVFWIIIGVGISVMIISLMKLFISVDAGFINSMLGVVVIVAANIIALYSAYKFL